MCVIHDPFMMKLNTEIFIHSFLGSSKQNVGEALHFMPTKKHSINMEDDVNILIS